MEFVRIILILKPEQLIRVQERPHTQQNQIRVHLQDQLIQVHPVQQQLTRIQAIPDIPDQVHPEVAQEAAHLTVVAAEAVHLTAVEVPLQAVPPIPVVEVVVAQAEVQEVPAQVQAPVDANTIIMN